MSIRREIKQLAQKHDLSIEAVETLAQSLQRGRYIQAQFNHPDLGGMGQWQPGLVMLGDMFNNDLKARVNAACIELSAALRRHANHDKNTHPHEESWWPSEFGTPTVTGGQKHLRYAYFSAEDRLVVQVDTALRAYDTTGFAVHGVSQYQIEDQFMIMLYAEAGTIPLEELPVIEF